MTIKVCSIAIWITSFCLYFYNLFVSATNTVDTVHVTLSRWINSQPFTNFENKLFGPQPEMLAISPTDAAWPAEHLLFLI